MLSQHYTRAALDKLELFSHPFQDLKYLTLARIGLVYPNWGIHLTTERAKTVAVACNGLIEMRRLMWNEVGVAATLMIIPIIIFAIIFRKYMVSGLTLGAVRE